MICRSVSALLLMVATLVSAEPVRQAHDEAAQLSAEAFAEMDRLMTRLGNEDQASRLAAQGQRQADQRALPLPKPVEAVSAPVPTPIAPAPQPVPTAPAGPPKAAATAPLTTDLVLVTTAAGDPVQDLDAVISGLGLATGIQARNGQSLIVSKGLAQVHGKPGTPAWAEARAVAYQSAVLRARAELASVLGEAVLSGRSLELLETPPQLDTGAPPAASREQIGTAAKTLEQAKLDAELRKLGVPPEQYEKLPPEQRRTLYAERYEQSIRTRAAAALAGCATLAVTEGPWQGNQCLCVALVWSQNLARLAAFANRFGGQLPPKPPAPGRHILAQIPADGLTLARRFGVQRCVDETGDVVIVAYGQAALIAAGPAMRATALATAFDKAALEAKAMLKDFVWQETDAEASRQFSQVVQATVGERSGDAQTVMQQQDRFQRSIRARSGELTLSGAGELRRWTAKVDGAEAAGVVIAWSPRRQQLAAAAISGPGGDVTGTVAPAGSNAGGNGTATFDPSW